MRTNFRWAVLVRSPALGCGGVMFGSRFRKNKADAISGFLGSQTEFTGKLSFSGTVHLDGNFEGEIISRGVLVVGSESVINAHIHSAVLKIAGEVRGDLTATEKIELYPPAKVYGNIMTPSLVVEEGVLFEGTCRMSAVDAQIPSLSEEGSEAAIDGEPLEAISARAWHPDYEEEGELEPEDPTEGSLHKSGQ
jgi:cytoskeletal protein CcmA (bactofilin family)